MERCPNCGNKLSKIDVLCPRCGSVVEVIQIKSKISVASEAVIDNKSNNMANEQRKDFPQNFIVYNEDFPTDDIGDSEPAMINDKQLQSAAPESFTKDDANDVDDDLLRHIQSSNINNVPPESTPSNYENDGQDKLYFTRQDAAEKFNEDNDYSPRYLENLKKLNLPEIDDINSFDPEEYMREYKYRKILGKQASADDNSAPVKKQWLEIEETEPSLANELEKVKENVQAQPVVPLPVERRFKGVQESRQERTQETVPSVRKPKSFKDKKTGKSSMLSTLLFWVVVSAAIFFCCIFFDNYVKSSFGTYDNFIYSITSGQVDIDPHNS